MRRDAQGALVILLQDHVIQFESGIEGIDIQLPQRVVQERLEGVSEQDELAILRKGVAESQLLADDATALADNLLGWLVSVAFRLTEQDHANLVRNDMKGSSSNGRELLNNPFQAETIRYEWNVHEADGSALVRDLENLVPGAHSLLNGQGHFLPGPASSIG